MSRKGLAALVTTAVVVAGALTACSSSSKSSGSGSSGSAKSSGGTYAVGFTSDLSGKYALNGVGQRDGFKAYFDYVNSQGGINGHKVDLTVMDDASDVTRGTANTTQLMTAKKDVAVAGYILSNVCGAAAVVAATNKVPINCGSLSDDLLNPVKPYVYSMGISQNEEAAPMIEMAKSLVTSAKPKVAIIIYASAASVSLAANVKKIADANGWDVVDNEQIPLTASDGSQQYNKVIASKPDVIIGALYDPLAVAFMRALSAAGLNTPFVDYDGATYKSSLLALKNPNLYVLSAKTLDGSGSGAGLTTYLAALKADNVDPTTPYVNNGYIQGLEIGESLRKCGYPCSGEQLQAAMDTLNFDTQGITSGNIVYTPTNHEALHSASFYVWDATKQMVVAAKTNLAEGTGS